MRIPSALLSTLALSASVLLPSALAKPAYSDFADGSRLLVVLDPKEVHQEQYTKFWSSLTDRGYKLTFRDVRATNAPINEQLTKFEEKQFDGLILFAPAVKSLPNDLSPQAIFSFLTTVSPESAPGNVLLALSPNLSEMYRDFAREFSIEFDERDTALYDPLHLASHSGSSVVVDVPAANTFSSSPILDAASGVFSTNTKKLTQPIKYSGPVHSTVDIPLLMPLLRAPSTSYPVEIKSGENAELTPVEGGPLVTGEQAKLVSAFQTRVNSRVVWSGSHELFSDKFWTDQTANEAFVNDVTKWLFNEKSVVEVLAARHFASNDPAKVQKEQYRIGEEMTYEIVVSQYADDKWTSPTIHDMQLEVTMLDPHLRIPLKASATFESRSITNRTYTATFRLPDRHGVFTLFVDHKRQGMSWLENKLQMSITPLRHDEYERFIAGALPYYATAGSMLVAWLIFSALWLGLKDDDVSKKGKKKAL